FFRAGEPERLEFWHFDFGENPIIDVGELLLASMYKLLDVPVRARRYSFLVTVVAPARFQWAGSRAGRWKVRKVDDRRRIDFVRRLCRHLRKQQSLAICGDREIIVMASNDLSSRSH